MTLPCEETQRDFLARIIRALEHGGLLTDAILDYIDAVLFSPEPERLAAFLTDDADSQRDSLLDLILYPDQALQIGLEPLLEIARFSAEDERQLHDRLVAQAIHARLTMPDGRQLVSIQVPDVIKSQYLARLNIAWQIHPHVATAIAAAVSAALGPAIKVRLRNAGFRMTSGQRVFLIRFLQRMTDSDPDYLACLDLVLSLLESAGEEVDGYDLLVEHKRSLFRSLQQARRFATLLNQSNMETLMLQGLRAPHASPTALMHHMRLIDLIGFGMFGNIEAIELPVETPVRQVSARDTAEAAFQSLMG